MPAPKNEVRLEKSRMVPMRDGVRLATDIYFPEIPDEKLNLYGGSISLGHPFAATGARQALTMANELVRRDSGTALVTQCAAGGLGAALILER